MDRPALQIKQVGVSRMAFRARKVFGTFEKRAPGHSSDFSVLKFVKYFCFCCCSHCRRFRVLKIAVTGGDVSMILLIDNTHANAKSLTMESSAKMLEVNTVVIKTIFVDG